MTYDLSNGTLWYDKMISSLNINATLGTIEITDKRYGIGFLWEN